MSGVTSSTPESFLSTPSVRRATVDRDVLDDAHNISIHALREEGDMLSLPFSNWISQFLSTPSVRRATRLTSLPPAFILFLSTPSVRRATISSITSALTQLKFLSTPSVRRATRLRVCLFPQLRISIHALRGGRRRSAAKGCQCHQFLSTPSVRRATVVIFLAQRVDVEFLSTPSVRRATRRLRSPWHSQRYFYPRPLLHRGRL